MSLIKVDMDSSIFVAMLQGLEVKQRRQARGLPERFRKVYYDVAA